MILFVGACLSVYKLRGSIGAPPILYGDTRHTAQSMRREFDQKFEPPIAEDAKSQQKKRAKIVKSEPETYRGAI